MENCEVIEVDKNFFEFFDDAKSECSACSAACEDDEVLREDERLKKLQEQIDHYRASIDSLDPTDNSNKLIIGQFEWAVKELKDLQSKEF